MDIYYLGKPTIPPKENHYIVRGIMTKGSQYSKSYFTTDFYVEKSNDDLIRISYQKTHKDFKNSKRKFKKETEYEFNDRITKQIHSTWIYFHYKGEGWCWDIPFFERKGFFVSNPRPSLEESV